MLFQRFTPAQPKIFAKISLYTTLAQPDFYYISKFDFKILYLHNLKSLSTIWLYTTCSLHLYNLISGFYTCTTWTFWLNGKVTYFMLHSQTLILFKFAKNYFCGFFVLECVCFLTYTYFVLIFMSKLSHCRKFAWPHDINST